MTLDADAVAETLAAARRLITAHAGVTKAILGDPTVDLRAWSQKAAEAAGGAEV